MVVDLDASLISTFFSINICGPFVLGIFPHFLFLRGWMVIVSSGTLRLAQGRPFLLLLKKFVSKLLLAALAASTVFGSCLRGAIIQTCERRERRDTKGDTQES